MLRKLQLVAILLLMMGTAMAQTFPFPLQHDVDDYIGTNSFSYLGTAVYKDGANLSVNGKALGWIREYHPLSLTMDNIDPTTGTAAWNNSSAWAGDYDAYYLEMKQLGIEVQPVFWNDDFTQVEAEETPSNYTAFAKHFYQFAARYGSVTVADNLLQVGVGTTKQTGLDYINSIEVWNEPDRTWCVDCMNPDFGWNTSMFTSEAHAAYLSACWDGHQGSLGADVGVKSADPSMKVISGGTYQLDKNYFSAMDTWFAANRTDGVIPVDVIAVHHYSNSVGILADVIDNANGISPESNALFNRLQTLVNWRNGNWPNVEIWFGEFGYDVNPASAQRAPIIGSQSAEEVQAIWNMRIYLLSMAAGIDRCASFMINDVVDGAAGAEKYQSSGMIAGVYGGVPRAQAYYMATLRSQLAGMKFLEDKNVSGDSLYIYKFKSTTGSNGAYVVWNGTMTDETTAGYSLDVESATTAQLVSLAHWDDNGTDPQSLTLSGGKVTVSVSEKPIIILVDDIDITFVDPPAPPTYSGATTFSTCSVTLEATNVLAGATVNWYSAYSANPTLIGTGNPLVTTGATGSNTYYITQTISGVESLYPSPAIFTVTATGCGGVTAVEDDLEAEIKIYPNPAESVVNVEAPLGSEIVVYNLIGNVLTSLVVNQSIETINIADLPQGLLLIEVTSEGTSSVTKVIKK